MESLLVLSVLRLVGVFPNKDGSLDSNHFLLLSCLSGVIDSLATDG